MADEELTTKVSVEGFEDFEKAFEKMAADLDTAEGALKDLGGESKKTSSSMDQAGQSFDKNAAKSNQLKLATLQLADVQKQLTTETDALKRAQLEVRADSLRQQIENLSKAEDDSAQNTQKMRLSLTDLKSGIDMAIGAVKAFAAIAKGAFEFAQEGAAINATKESFDRLGISIEGLRAASNNTIPDMALMSSTLTLMAGSGGEVADAFSGAMPQLLAMAKAANKLNPTMGDTAYMLQSITTAAKRQSMQIADNLGIIVKQGDAYKKYADSIGVSVTALTNEQKQVAFLNGLLEAGNVLIEQAGGATESAADGYAQMTTQVKNATDSMKALTAEAVGPSISKFAQLLVSTNEVREEYGYLLGTMAGFGEMLGAGNTLIDKRTEAQAAAAEQDRISAASIALYTEFAKQASVVTFEVTEAMLDETGAVIDSTDAWDQYNTAANQTTGVQLAVTGSVEASAQAVNAYRAALGGAISNEMIAFRDREGELIAKGEELRAKISELEKKQYLTTAQKEQLIELRTQLDENGKAIDDNVAKHEEATKRILLGFLEQRLGMDTLTTEELLALQKMANEWGLLDDSTYAAIKSIDAYAKSAEMGASDTDTLIDRVSTLGDRLLGLPKEIPIRIAITTTGQIPNIPGKGDPYQTWQHGGTTPDGAFIAGDQGPELVTGMRGGGRVMSAPTTARMMAQGNVTNNFNLTTNSLTRPGGLALEFATMGMGSR